MDKKSKKINQIIQEWPRGTVAVYSWFKQYGVYPQLVDKYLKSSWINRLAPGAFTLAGDKVEWFGGVYALQKYLKLFVHPGGKTALQIHGLAHFVPSADSKVQLFGLPEEKLPAWFEQHDWRVKINFLTPKLFLEPGSSVLAEKNFDGVKIHVSSPELAIMEFLQTVPQHESFNEAQLLMEGLTTLRPQLVQSLLEDCCSIKVKRLFMHLAENSEHPWASRIDLSNVDFGKGKRVIGEGGHYDPKYQISVPKIVE